MVQKSDTTSNVIPFVTEIPMPLVEVAPRSVLFHVPLKDEKGKTQWYGIQLSPEEAKLTGSQLIQGADMSTDMELDS